MEEFDLQEIWENSDDKANRFYETIEPQILTLARQRSNNTLTKVKRNLIKEMIVGIVPWIFIFYFWSSHPYFLPVAILVVVLTAVYFYNNWKLMKNIDFALTQNVVSSIEINLEILSKHYSKVKWQTKLFVPIFFLIGIMASLFDDGGWENFDVIFDWKFVLLFIVFSIPTYYLLHWLTFKKQFVAMYEKPIAELKEILEQLREEE